MNPKYILSALIGFGIWRGFLDRKVSDMMAEEGESFAEWYKDIYAG